MRFLPLLCLAAQVAGLAAYAVAPRFRDPPDPQARAEWLRAEIAELRSWQEDRSTLGYCSTSESVSRYKGCARRLEMCLDILEYGPMELP